MSFTHKTEKPNTIKCLYCGKLSKTFRTDKKFCSNSCRVLSYRNGEKHNNVVLIETKQQQTTPKQSTNNTQKINGVVGGQVSIDSYLKAIEEKQRLLLEKSKLEIELEYMKKRHNEEIEMWRKKINEIDNSENNQLVEMVVDAISKKMGI